MSYLFVLTSVVIVMPPFVFVVIWGEPPRFVAILVHGGVLMYRSNLEANSIAPMLKMPNAHSSYFWLAHLSLYLKFENV